MALMLVQGPSSSNVLFLAESISQSRNRLDLFPCRA